MDSFLLDFAVSTILATVKLLVKNPGKRTQLKKVMLKVRNSINAAYADDPDFE